MVLSVRVSYICDKKEYKKENQCYTEVAQKSGNWVFKSLDHLVKAHKRYISGGNNVARCVLNFKSPNQIVQQHLLQSA